MSGSSEAVLGNGTISVNRTICVVVCVSTLLLAAIQQSRSEPRRYDGSLNNNPIIAFVEFRDNGSVDGLFYKKDDPGRAFVFKGSNPRQGLILIRVAQGENRVGIAELEKSPSSDSITWQGQMRFADDVSLALSFSRPSTTGAVSEVEPDAQQPSGPTETAEFHRNRAIELEDGGNLDAAIAEYDHAIELDPHDVTAFTFRADDKWKKGQLRPALADYRRAIAIDSNFHRALNGLAWKLATCANAQIRDGREAKSLALKACEIKDNARNTDTLAAAYGETGNFEEAIDAEKRAIEKGQEENISEQKLDGYRQRLQLYQDHEPYRTSGDD